MQTKEWTLMFYFASDNPLASTIVSQLKALKDAGYHPDANVIAQFDPHVVNTPVHVFDVNCVNKFWNPGKAEVGFAPNDPFIRDLVLDRLWGEKDEEIRTHVVNHVMTHRSDVEFNPPKPSAAMSREQNPKVALSSFLSFCREYYPARHYLLFILGHGQVVGNDTLLYDDHAGQNSLLLTELGEVLRAFNSDVHNDREPGEVELIGLHSCSMSAIEVAYELKGATNYLLASQGPAYVGSWPYKQILIQIFNDLNCDLTTADVNGSHDGRPGKQSFVEKLLKADEPVARFVRNELKKETKAALKKHKLGTRPDPALVSTIVTELNELIDSKAIAGAEEFMNVPSRNGTGQLKELDLSKLNDRGLRRLSRLLLADAFPEIARHPKVNVETMFSKIFYYCLYNSYDYQLAGYPYDMCLADLTQVSTTEDPINNLADSLINGLQDQNPMTKQLVLLAHWDAQSFYQEDYVDLYDFCFCLVQRYNRSKQYLRPVRTMELIVNACEEMMTALEKADRDKLIIHAAFSGAAFQYSHGMSIYFPWTEPVASDMWDTHYPEYRLNKATRWREFLKVYFTETMRQTRTAEMEAAGKRPLDVTLSGGLLDLMGQIGAKVFDAQGQLQKPGPDHPMGRYGPDDPTGGGCDCPTIKNHPLFTGKLAVSDDFLAGKEITKELPDG